MRRPVRTVLHTGFARGRITLLRRAVAEQAGCLGLSGRRLEDFVLAVNEVTTNAVLHGGGRGSLRLWSDAGRLWCQVADAGPGIPAGWLDAERPPPGMETSGRGLWLMRTLCEEVTIVTGPGGTTITFAAARD
ncbi:ATP-binding protein [Nonomuraea sp. NBC_01738]|uniref:ATP-binding protein n=1 Tax=Nonomuraea sp. NBC_01738 TaxID=2976003 RepID=UPI002E0D96A0|nr:ATP-binding protein [Nonomuraea sp. NBC_01738]